MSAVCVRLAEFTYQFSQLSADPLAHALGAARAGAALHAMGATPKPITHYETARKLYDAVGQPSNRRG
jgi:hypothetical protein